MLKILHLSDLHLDLSKYDQEIVVRALMSDLVSQTKLHKIDLVVFSGDLTNRGSQEEFAAAGSRFLDEVLNRCGLHRDQLLLVPGNHDVQKKSVDDNLYLEKGLLSELSNLEKVNYFVDRVIKNDPATAVAFARLDNYESFVNSYLTDRPTFNTPLVKVYKKSIDNIKIGFCCFNTAWRCTGAANDADKGKLLLGERTVDIALDHLNGMDLNIAVFHHPLDYLAPFEASAVEARLVVGFDILLFGHVHSGRPLTQQSPTGGAFFGQGGCIYSHREYHNSYQVIEIDNVERKGIIFGQTYFNANRSFRPSVDILDIDGKYHFELPIKNFSYEDVNRILSAIRPFVRRKANTHVTIDASIDKPLDDIGHVFVCPPMHFGAFTSRAVKSALTKAEVCTVDSIVASSSNFVIYGPRESGKTSLAYLISLKFAEGFGDCARIPIMVDAQSLGVGDYEFRRATSGFYAGGPLASSRVNEVISKFPIIVLLDNFNGLVDEQCLTLEWLSKRPNTRLICFHVDSLDAILPSKISSNGTFRAIHIESLPRNSIRKLSTNRISSNAQNRDFFDNIMQSLVSAQLPWNGYIVSLLLWAYEQNRTFERLNEAVLIENIVSFLLDKGSFSSVLRKTFDPRSKEIILQALAINFSKNKDSMRESELYQFIFEFFFPEGARFFRADNNRAID